MKYRDASEKLKSLGCEVVLRRGKGSHRVWHDPANARIATLPDWGTKDLKIGTIRSLTIMDIESNPKKSGCVHCYEMLAYSIGPTILSERKISAADSDKAGRMAG